MFDMQDLRGFVVPYDAKLPEDSLLQDRRVSTVCGIEDDYGKEALSLRPERLLEVGSNVSNARLLKLPIELLAKVVAKIPSKSLNNLALMNKDCREIARSLQFASVFLDFSAASWELMLELRKESIEGAVPTDNARSEKLALGKFIRSLTVATSEEWTLQWYKLENYYRHGAMPRTGKKAPLRTCKIYFEAYLKTILRLLDDRSILPNLQLLKWDFAPVLPDLLDAITNLKITHLKLSCVRVYPLRALNLPHSWPLQSLHLDIKPLADQPVAELWKLSLNLVLHCASDLKLLTWIGHHNRTHPPISTDHLESTVSFPSLRHLRLRTLGFADGTLLQKLVHDDLVSLVVDPVAYQLFFNTRGPMNKLKLLVCSIPRRRIEKPIAFLRDNKHLPKLAISHPLPASVIEAYILPPLARTFLRLTSLSLTWEEEAWEEEQDISDHALVLISQIRSLEQLHLSVGTPELYRSTWFVNSRKMRRHLSKLPRLKKLAFTGDAYLPNGSQTDHESDEDQVIEEEKAIEEDEAVNKLADFIENHRRPLEEALRYILKMPQLEWLFIGQIPCAVANHPNGAKELIPIDRSHIGDYWSVLQGMFGWRGLSVWHSG
ncbi:MAG: hypothetical protein LQ339_006244 [Xanthoria mediterranea]|nr:MAG: hypothetical protein LQ339_006244 [Xanthoria mediterranea]